MSLKPSNFLSHPWGSVMQNCEYETIARNIMVMLSRCGNTWKPLTWEKYVFERIIDGAKESEIERERPYFDRVVGFCVSAESANAFAPGWGKE